MKLLTKELEKKLIEAVKINKKAKSVDDHIIYAKFFYPAGYATYFVTEYYPEDQTCFGYAILQPGCGEYGYFSFAEISAFKGRMGLGFERDMYFKPVRAGDCQELQDYITGKR